MNHYVSSVGHTAVAQWAASTVYSVGDLRRQLAAPSVGNERVWRCTTAGTSGGSEPAWTLTEGSTTADNDVVWTEVTGQETYNWTAPHARLATANVFAAGGDVIFVSHQHAETQATANPLLGGGIGSASSPITVICVSDAGSVPPISADLRTTATVSTTGVSTITLGSNGFGYVYGISFLAGDGSNNASIIFGGSTPFWWKYEQCTFKLNNTGGSSDFRFGNPGSSGDDYKLEFVGVTFQFGANATQQMNIKHGRVSWLGGSVVVGATLPTTLFVPSGQASLMAVVEIRGVDLSAFSNTLVAVNADTPTMVIFSNCKLHTSVSLVTAGKQGQGGTEVTLVNCDSGDTNYRYQKEVYQGTITSETVIVRTGGATDGTTPVSRKMVSSAGAKQYSPLEMDASPIWNEVVGSAKTVTVEIITDNITLKDNEAWVEVEYLGTSGFPLSLFVNDGVDVLAAGANQETSTVDWTTTGLTTPVKQKLSVTITPQEKGAFKVKVMLAKASTTMYVDPLPVVS